MIVASAIQISTRRKLWVRPETKKVSASVKSTIVLRPHDYRPVKIRDVLARTANVDASRNPKMRETIAEFAVQKRIWSFVISGCSSWVLTRKSLDMVLLFLQVEIVL